MKIQNALLMVLFLLGAIITTADEFGKFIGPVQTEWLGNGEGRKMKLLADFKYVDPTNSEWLAPKDAVIDGASIPKAFWSFIGGPFEDLYRDASVIHDVACDDKSRPWELVHENFYLGMRCSGVGLVKAKIMYAAVYYFGPRWPESIEIETTEGNVEGVLKTLESTAPTGSEIYPFLGASPPRGNTPAATSRLKLMATVVPPPNPLTQEDFLELSKKIEQSNGEIPLAGIRQFSLAKYKARPTQIIRNGALMKTKQSTEKYFQTHRVEK